jgi:hypothetical protein
MRRRYEEQAAMWKHMRGWRPQFGLRYWKTPDGYRRAAAICGEAESEAAMIRGWKRRAAEAEAAALADLATERAQRRAELAAELDPLMLQKNFYLADQAKSEQKEKIYISPIFNDLKKSARDGGGDRGDRGGASPQHPPPRFGENSPQPPPSFGEKAQETPPDVFFTTAQETTQAELVVCERCDNPANDRAAAQGRPRMAIVGGRVVVCPGCGGTGKRRA